MTKKDAGNAVASPERPRAEELFQRPEEVLQFISRSMEFIRELMEENERLRYRAVQLQEENRELFDDTSLGRRVELLRRQIHQLEQERDRLREEYKRVEEANRAFASRYVEIEEENNNLANLYVCSFQLHSTLIFDEVIQIIMEIIINLIGAEEFAIFLLDEKTGVLRVVAKEGLRLEGKDHVAPGEGVIGQAAMSGQNYYDPAINTPLAQKKRGLDDPLVCIPLMIRGRPFGTIALYKLLPQKKQFANVDYELFTLLAGHAATAIFSAKLYAEAQRKLHTIKGLMDLLTSSESG